MIVLWWFLNWLRSPLTPLTARKELWCTRAGVPGVVNQWGAIDFMIYSNWWCGLLLYYKSESRRVKILTGDLWWMCGVQRFPFSLCWVIWCCACLVMLPCSLTSHWSQPRVPSKLSVNVTAACLCWRLLRQQPLPQAHAWQGCAQRQCQAVSVLTCSVLVLPAAMVLMGVFLLVEMVCPVPGRGICPCASAARRASPAGEPGRGCPQMATGQRSCSPGLVRSKLGQANPAYFCSSAAPCCVLAGRERSWRLLLRVFLGQKEAEMDGELEEISPGTRDFPFSYANSACWPSTQFLLCNVYQKHLKCFHCC